VYDEAYGNSTEQEDLQPPDECLGTHVLVGARKADDPEGVLVLAAIGRREVVLAETTDNDTKEDNGVWWSAPTAWGLSRCPAGCSMMRS
jgi:hypothetical protein